MTTQEQREAEFRNRLRRAQRELEAMEQERAEMQEGAEQEEQ